MPKEPKEPVKNNGHWRDKFGGRVRFPRPWNGDVKKLLHDCWPTEVFLNEDEKTTDLVLRFPVSSKRLPEQIRNRLFSYETSLTAAFDEMVWIVPKGKRETCWALLARAAHECYWSAWMHLLTTRSADISFPAVNVYTSNSLNELEQGRRRSGRRKELDAERQSHQRRFAALLRWCEELHKLVKQSNEEGDNKEAIEQKVFKRMEGQRHIDDVLNGTGFDWVVNSAKPKLHDAETWTPRRLASQLLALELGREFDTIVRKMGTPPTK